jgi:hypothetical protein
MWLHLYNNKISRFAYLVCRGPCTERSSSLRHHVRVDLLWLVLVLIRTLAKLIKNAAKAHVQRTFEHLTSRLPLQLKAKVAQYVTCCGHAVLINASSLKSYFLQEETHPSETTQIGNYHFAKSLISTTSQDAQSLDHSLSRCISQSRRTLPQASASSYSSPKYTLRTSCGVCLHPQSRKRNRCLM